MNTCLFALKDYDENLHDYFLDADGQLWSSKSGYPKMIRKNRNKIILNGQRYIFSILVYEVKNSQQWKDYMNTVTKKSDNSIVEVKKEDYVIALIDDSGVLKFSSNPKVHKSVVGAIEEMKRLTSSNPGKKFAYFQCKGIAITKPIT